MRKEKGNSKSGAKKAKKIHPVGEGKILVKSKTYGDHPRNKRGTIKEAVLNDDMKLSGSQTKLANLYAKAVKDPLDPFREKFHDGTMWSTLLSLFKKQLWRDGLVDLKSLEEFQCHSEYPLTRLFQRKISASVSSGATLDIEVITHGGVKRRSEKAKDYRQILIVIFYNDDFKPTVESETAFFKLGIDKRNKQNVSVPIPKGSIVALVALRCDHWKDGLAGGFSRRGLEILKAIDLRTS
ncbi:hypothetical protein WBG78_20785 [Chryseolinea sp. T2]|uniref:hypothetical protein n=1 Tax=Chryseolinea sp. T2 TaxID=3129255 RepID=UPI003078174A